jgi:hypothetical protein
MMKNRHIYWLMSVGVLLAVFLSIVGCEKKIVNDESTSVVSVAIDAKALTPGTASYIDRYELVIEGADFGTIIVPMERQGSTLFVTAEVPVGKDRRFSARAYQKDALLYRGDQTIDVIPRAPIVLNLVLAPVAPMLNITPHMQNYLMGDSFYVDVNVFNIKSLSGISFIFTINYSPCYIDTVVIGDQYNPDSVGLTYVIGYDTVNVDVNPRNETYPIVDARGDAHLATIWLNSYNDWNINVDTATVVMQVSASWLYSSSGSQFPLDSLYYDNAEVLLTRPDSALAKVH